MTRSEVANGLEDAERLRARLRAFVTHEHVSALRSRQEIWSQCIADRVDAGECVARLVPVGSRADGALVFDAPEFHGKFREGEPLYLGDGENVENGHAVSFVQFDVASSRVFVTPDRFESRGAIELDPDLEYCLDRRGLGLERLLLEGLDTVFRTENHDTLEVLLGRANLDIDAARYERATAHAATIGFTDAQCEALGRAVAADGLVMIQGPPGTGKTRVLAEAAVLLARMRCRIFVCGFTHRAVENLMLAIRALDAQVPLYKVGGNREQNGELVAADVRLLRKLERAPLPAGGSIVGGTPFAARRFSNEKRFQFVFVDEAGQMPVVHGAIAMSVARRQVVCGDPRQLPPVRQGSGRDTEVGTSLYAFLESVTTDVDPVLLDRSFRLNDELTRFVSREYYNGRLAAADVAAQRRLREVVARQDLRGVLDPEKPLVIARIDHEGRRRRSTEEVACVADLVAALVIDGGLDPGEVAVLSPFRAQCRAIRHEIERRGLSSELRVGLDGGLVVDTVERMQGQEREAVILSLAASDRDALEARAQFFYEPGRLNVALTRARTKCIVVASPHAFRARPQDLDALLRVARFKRLYRQAPVVDVSARYLGT